MPDFSFPPLLSRGRWKVRGQPAAGPPSSCACCCSSFAILLLLVPPLGRRMRRRRQQQGRVGTFATLLAFHSRHVTRPGPGVIPSPSPSHAAEAGGGAASQPPARQAPSSGRKAPPPLCGATPKEGRSPYLRGQLASSSSSSPACTLKKT